MPLDADFYAQPVVDLAQALIGCTLEVDGVGGIIVETEAYRDDDAASHSFGGPRTRNAAMFGAVGTAYVYRIYGLHWCFNVVGGDRPGGAVLIRAIEPIAGLATMAARRGTDDIRKFCAGPGRLCSALAITGAFNTQALDRPPLVVAPRSAQAPIVSGPRIGIAKAIDAPWRFGLAGSAFLSRPFATRTP